MRRPNLSQEDFTKIAGPSKEDLQAIEQDDTPSDIPGVPVGSAVASMCVEYTSVDSAHQVTELPIAGTIL